MSNELILNQIRLIFRTRSNLLPPVYIHRFVVQYCIHEIQHVYVSSCALLRSLETIPESIVVE